MFRFEKKKRLLQKSDFVAVLQGQCIFRNHFFGAHILLNRIGNARLGLTVSKKINRHANQRNAIKRMAREYFRLHESSWPTVDVIIRARCAYHKEKRLAFWKALDDIDYFMKNYAI